MDVVSIIIDLQWVEFNMQGAESSSFSDIRILIVYIKSY